MEIIPLEKLIADAETRTNYMFIKVIGEGGFGTVMKIKDKTTGLFKAAKVVSYATSGDDLGLKLDHPNIVSVHEKISLSGNGCAFIMPFYEYDLLDLTNSPNFNTNPDSYFRKKRYLHQILCGLDYLHCSNICHFDLKVDNIMIDINSDTAIIGDFSTVSKISKHKDYYFSIRHIFHPPEYVGYQRNRKVNPYSAEMWTFGILTVQIFSMYVLDRQFCDRKSTAEDVQDFLDDLMRGINIKIVLRKSHPMNVISAVDVEGFISFLDQFLLMTPRQRVPAGIAKSHSFLTSPLCGYRAASTRLDEVYVSMRQWLERGNHSSYNDSSRPCNCRASSFISDKEAYMNIQRWGKDYLDYYTRMDVEKVRGDRGFYNDLSDFQPSKVNDPCRLDQPSGSQVCSSSFAELNETFHQNSTKVSVDNMPILDFCSGCYHWWAREIHHECKNDQNSVKILVEDKNQEANKSCFS